MNNGKRLDQLTKEELIKADHGFSVCYTLANVKGITFDDLCEFLEDILGKKYMELGGSVNHLGQPWLQYESVKPTKVARYVFFFLSNVEETEDMPAFEICLRNPYRLDRPLRPYPYANTAALPWVGINSDEPIPDWIKEQIRNVD